jgi:hypothetical protein
MVFGLESILQRNLCSDGGRWEEDRSRVTVLTILPLTEQKQKIRNKKKLKMS